MNIKNSLTDIDLNNIHTFNLDINLKYFIKPFKIQLVIF